MHRTARTLALLSALCGLSGCSSDDPSPSAELPARLADLARGYCEWYFQCRDFVHPTVIEHLYLGAVGIGDVDRCTELLAPELVSAGEIEALQRAIDEGRVVFHPARAVECAETISSDACSLSVPLPLTLLDITEPCATTFEGTVEEGAPCLLDEECVAGFECDATPGSCGGTCAAILDPEHTVPLGEACNTSDDCAYGTICHESVCKTLSIAADLDVGEPCNADEATATSFTLRACEPELRCALVDEVPVCAERLPAGADCTANPTMPCAEGELCLEDAAPATTFSCQPVLFAAEEGADCTDFATYEGGSITFCDAALGLYCGTSATCVSAGTGEAGSDCAVDEGDGPAFNQVCEAGLYCDDSSGECAPKKAATAACDDSDECASDLCLDGACAEAYCDTVDTLVI